MTAKVKQKESGSLSSRDLIALGVFSLLFMVVSMLVVGITSMSVVAYCGCCAIAAIPAGIVWVYMHARVPRAGTSLIMALVFAVIVFVIGSGWPVRSASPSAAPSPSWRGSARVREVRRRRRGVRAFRDLLGGGPFRSHVRLPGLLPRADRGPTASTRPTWKPFCPR